MPSDDRPERIQRQVERLFHDVVYQRHPACHFAESTWAPAADVVVSDHSARVILELAGVPRDKVRVRVRGQVLEISGRRDPPRDPATSHYHRAEIYFGEFRRLIELPWNANDAKIEAHYRDGMLEIQVVRARVVTPVAVEPQHSK